MSRRKILPYNPDLKILAKELRQNMTFSEVLLWNKLKTKKMLEFDFDRQRPIGNFIVDFYYNDLALAIEIDGDTHLYRYDYDEQRQRELESLGVTFLRFDDIEIKKDINNVLRVIQNWINNNLPTPETVSEAMNEYPIQDRKFDKTLQPTPCPSQEGNAKTGTTCSEGNVMTQNTPREGNAITKIQPD